MPIVPLPVFEKEADPSFRSVMSDEEIYARLEAPKTIVVRFGYLKHVGEFQHNTDAKPGCGSKLVARTPRGTEVVEMLTTTCSNSGCGKSVSRREMLDYIEHSGGKDYPFHTNGRVIRVATIEDLNQQSALDSVRREAVKTAKALVSEFNLPMKVVEAEPILGGECLTIYYMAENRVDFREMVNRLASQFATRIEMRQVGARDEARLVADYERCGQHCCCKNFLKVLKPVSMRQAKVQKATLDPLKISGRCGRLMCCLRYEDQTYKELKSKLPSRNKRVGTAEGPGVVVDSKILVQLVLVRLDHDMREIAVPVEELLDPDKCPRPATMDQTEARESRGSRREDRSKSESPRDRRNKPTSAVAKAAAEEPQLPSSAPTTDDPLRGLTENKATSIGGKEGGRKKKRRRRRKGKGAAGDIRTPSESTRHQQQDAFRAMAQDLDDSPDDGDGIETGTDTPENTQDGRSLGATQVDASGGGSGRKRKRKRRRRKRGGKGGGASEQSPPSPNS